MLERPSWASKTRTAVGAPKPSLAAAIRLSVAALRRPRVVRARVDQAVGAPVISRTGRADIEGVRVETADTDAGLRECGTLERHAEVPTWASVRASHAPVPPLHRGCMVLLADHSSPRDTCSPQPPYFAPASHCWLPRGRQKSAARGQPPKLDTRWENNVRCAKRGRGKVHLGKTRQSLPPSQYEFAGQRVH